jgi:hypothetical protein
MVHNSATGEYECADAYFGLLDDGILGEFGAGMCVEVDALTAHQRVLHEHWLAARVPDGSDIFRGVA